MSRAPLAATLLAGLSLAGCDDVRLGRPDALWLLWLVPAVVVFQAWGARRRSLLLRRFAGAAMLDRLVLGASRARRSLKSALVVIGPHGEIIGAAGSDAVAVASALAAAEPPPTIATWRLRIGGGAVTIGALGGRLSGDLGDGVRRILT